MALLPRPKLKYASVVYGSIFGGHLMSLVDKACGIAAFRHARSNVVTMSVDSLVFRNPAPVGTILSLKASVNRVFNSSMEVGVKVMGLRRGAEEEIPICHAYLTFVAVDASGRPAPVPPIQPETAEQRRRWQEAGLRREARLALAASLKRG